MKVEPGLTQPSLVRKKRELEAIERNSSRQEAIYEIVEPETSLQR
jgi:hypothetical protein